MRHMRVLGASRELHWRYCLGDQRHRGCFTALGIEPGKIRLNLMAAPLSWYITCSTRAFDHKCDEAQFPTRDGCTAASLGLVFDQVSGALIGAALLIFLVVTLNYRRLEFVGIVFGLCECALFVAWGMSGWSIMDTLTGLRNIRFEGRVHSTCSLSLVLHLAAVLV